MTQQKTFAPPVVTPPSDVLTLEQFAAVYAAAEFAACFGIWMDSHVIINWTALGIEEKEVGAHFQAFTKCLRDFMSRRQIMPVWLYAHERSPKTGLHTHLALSLPCDHQRLNACVEWLRSWLVRLVERRVPRAIRLRVSKRSSSMDQTASWKDPCRFPIWPPFR